MGVGWRGLPPVVVTFVRSGSPRRVGAAVVRCLFWVLGRTEGIPVYHTRIVFSPPPQCSSQIITTSRPAPTLLIAVAGSGAPGRVEPSAQRASADVGRA